MVDNANLGSTGPDVSSAADLPPELIQQLKGRLIAAANLHDVLADSVMFNEGTILVLPLTTLATLFPSIPSVTPYPWAAPLCSGLAGLFVAMERALGFGARWRYHREMRFAYESIIDMLDFFQSFQSQNARNISAIYSRHCMRFDRGSRLFQMQGLIRHQLE